MFQQTAWRYLPVIKLLSRPDFFLHSPDKHEREKKLIHQIHTGDIDERKNE